MFVQIIKGKTNDAQALRGQFDRWRTDLADSATGWRNTTAGVADDGQFVALVEFESAEAARRNSERPEQGEWWSATEPLLSDVEFTDTEDVTDVLGGPKPDAAFVQVIEAEVTDLQRAKEFGAQAEQALQHARPDVVGMRAAFAGNKVIQAVYFTDEDSARKGETSQPSAEDAEQLREMDEVFQNPTYIDLRNPWHERP